MSGHDYGASIPRWRWIQVHHRLVQRMIVRYASRLVPIHLGIDPVQGFDPSCAVHPNPSGYKQLAQAMHDALAFRFQPP